jgi:hypothetical protein
MSFASLSEKQQSASDPAYPSQNQSQTAFEPDTGKHSKVNSMAASVEQKRRIASTIIAAALLTASLIMLFCVFLSGAKNSGPLDQLYFIEVKISSTKYLSPAGSLRWTAWNICGVQDGRSVNCSKTSPGHPYDPAEQVLNSVPALPKSVIEHSAESATATRTSFAFLVLAIVVACVTLAIAPGSCLGRWGSLASLVSGTFMLFFLGVTAVVATVVFCNARDRFQASDIDVKLGIRVFAFLWSSVVFNVLAIAAFALAAGPWPTKA